MVGAPRSRAARALVTAALLLVASALRVPGLSAQADGQPPTIVSHSPGDAAGTVSIAVNLDATFSEPVQPASISFVLRTSTNVIVPAFVTYDPARRTAILDPVENLISETYTATVNGARDFAGNVQSAPVVWSFTVASPGFDDPVVLNGLVNPTALAFAPDGRVFVADQSGLIKVFASLTDTTPTVFADLRTNVHDYGERGLLGIVLDPAFPTRPYVYVLYTHDAGIGTAAPRWGSPGSFPDPCPDPFVAGCIVSARLSRLQASGDEMTGTERVLVEDWFQQFPGQSIGSLAFGPDGALYASAGDGAGSTFVDAGQAVSPSPDPPNEGGALRSQDLRTPADPVTLDGTIIRVDPDTGLPVRRRSSMSAGAPTLGANGVKGYSVTSVFQGPAPTIVRVLEPSNPAPGKPHRIMFVLPVAAGVTSLASAHSDGLEELRLLNVHNRFNVTLIAPSFHIEPWYGDHSTAADRRLESFIVNDLVPFGDTFAAPGETPQRWLIGFSKSGTGVLSIIFRHPNVFSAAAAWDAPAQFTDMSAFPGMAENFGTEENFDRFEIPTLVARNAAAFRQRRRIWISGDESAWTSHMVELHQQMNQAGVLHTFTQNGPRSHLWSSGWLEGAIVSLDANAASAPPIDLNAERVVAYGLRRPDRFTFRPGTSEIWVGDIGSNTSEEVNRIVDASDGTLENFGWPCYEGTGTTPYAAAGLSICDDLIAQLGAATPPLHVYAHNQPLFAGDTCTLSNSSISGIAFAGAGTYPAAYEGALFLADRLRNCIWVMFKGAGGLPNRGNSATVIARAASPVDLRIGPGGDLYYADHDGGTVRRLRYSSGNLPPVAAIQAGPATSGVAPLTVNFGTMGSTDPEGASIGYAWDLDGDGSFDDSASAAPSFTYTLPGSRTVRVRVTDGQGLSSVAAVVIATNNTAPTATINTPSASLNWSVGGVISFSGSASDAEDGVLPAVSLSWSVILHHCPSVCHTHALADFTGASGSFVAPDHESPSHLELRLTATDSLSHEATTSVLLQPRTVALNFASVPTGVQLTVGPTTSTTPFSRTVVVGSSTTISAVSPQGALQFLTWSDGGAQTHSIVAGSSPGTFTAGYSAPVPPNLVLGLSFDAGSGTSAADSSVNSNNGTVSGATWTTAGKFGNALSFDGVNDWVTVADANALDLTTGMTLEAWVFPTASGSSMWRTVVIKERATGEVYNLYAAATGSMPMAFVVRAAQTGTALEASGSTAISLTAWTHLAVTFDNTTLRLFVNGVQAGTRAVAGPLLTSTGALRIGGNSVWGEFFQGRLDEVRVYNRALSTAEIQSDMSTPLGAPVADTTAPVRSTLQPAGTLAAGTTQTTLSLTTDESATCRYHTAAGVAYAAMTQMFATTGGTAHTTSVSGLANGGSYTYYVRCQDTAGNPNATDVAIAFSVAVLAPPDTTLPLVTMTAPASGATVSGAVTLSATASDNVGVAGVQFLLNGSPLGAEDTTAPYSITWSSTSVANGGPYLLSARARDAANNQATATAVSVTVNNTSLGVVASYNFNEASGTTLNDRTGTGHTGAISGAVWTTAGKSGGALTFDGVNDWVTVGDANDLDLTTGMTLEAWVFPTASGGGLWRNVLIKERAGGEVYNLYAAADNAPAAFVVRAAQAGAPLDAIGTTATAINTWTHLAVTYDNTTLRLFVNGAQVGTRAAAGPLLTSTGVLRIGGNSLWGEFFAGRIDDVRVYSRALSATEIQVDSNTPVP